MFFQHPVKALFHNPWSTVHFLTFLTRQAFSKTKRDMADTSQYERTTIPANGRPPSLTVYALTTGAENKHLGIFRTKESLLRFLFLTYDRTTIARNFIMQYFKPDEIDWCISPWMPYRSKPIFDALVKAKSAGNEETLFAFVAPTHHLGYQWYASIVSYWQEWKKDISSKAQLFFLFPTLPKTQRDLIGYRMITGDDIFVVTNKSGQQKLSIQPFSEKKKPHRRRQTQKTEHWSVLDSISDIPPQNFSDGITRHPRYRKDTLLFWLQTEGDPQTAGRAFYEHNSNLGIELLLVVMRFPGMSIDNYKELLSSGRAKKLCRQTLKQLEKESMVLCQVLDDEQLYFPTEQGALLIGSILGLHDKRMLTHFGWRVGGKQILATARHHASTRRLMVSLRQQKALAGWDYLNARFAYSDIKWYAPANGTDRVMIVPDSAIIINMSSTLKYFWVEIDRGTRRGNKLFLQLRKYFLAYYALKYQTLIPPIMYVIDADNGNSETRLRRVLSKLDQCNQEYPDTPIRILLTTRELLDMYQHDIIGSRIWRVFTKGERNMDLVSLSEAF